MNKLKSKNKLPIKFFYHNIIYVFEVIKKFRILFILLRLKYFIITVSFTKYISVHKKLRIEII